jgi:ferredoxin
MIPKVRVHMKRKIIRIDQGKCTGCSLCATDCPEGALRVIDGKARLVGDLLCDGLGACLASCPEDAISVEERDAEPYDEIKVMENIVPQGKNVLQAHLNHLKSHRQTTYLEQAVSYLKERKLEVPPLSEIVDSPPAGHQCPGSQILAFPSQKESLEDENRRPSRLTHWPIQLHLISPNVPHYQNSDLLVAADCVAYSLADFHRDYLKDRTLVIACPKLDSNQEVYSEKLTAFIDQAGIRSVKVVIMQVPCCSGLLCHVVEAVNQAERKIPVTCVVVGIQGEILREELLQEVV